MHITIQDETEEYSAKKRSHLFTRTHTHPQYGVQYFNILKPWRLYTNHVAIIISQTWNQKASTTTTLTTTTTTGRKEEKKCKRTQSKQAREIKTMTRASNGHITCSPCIPLSCWTLTKTLLNGCVLFAHVISNECEFVFENTLTIIYDVARFVPDETAQFVHCFMYK